MAGWLAAASVAVAQTGGSTGTSPPVKGKTLSPYYATASTVDWSNDGEPPPELLPPLPSTPVVPAAPAPSVSQVRQAAVMMQPSPATPTLPPVANTPPPPVATTPAGPGTPAAKPPVPAAPSGSVSSGTGSGSCGCGSCGSTAPTCNCGMSKSGLGGALSGNGHMWVDAELLLWWNKGMNVPPLVTASPAGTPRNLAGVLGAPTTAVLFGGDTVDDEMEPGFRVRAGMWLDDCNLCGVEGSFFFLGTASKNATFNCNDAPIIARPFIDVNPGVTNPFNAQLVGFGSPNSELVCLPGLLNGTINVHTSTDLYGFDANFRHNLLSECGHRLDLLVGYRYLNLKDRVDITENLNVLSNANPALAQGTTFLLQDSFKSTNDFNGGQIGLVGERQFGQWFLGARNLVALGNTHSDVTINGFTRITSPAGVSTVNAGGLLTQPTNIGSFSADKFAVVYEAETMLGYQLTDSIRAFAAYSFLYWSNVARAGDQIDLVVNSSQIPPGTLNGVARPLFVRHAKDFWAQGISFGMEMKY
jgi:hypothetical protein